MKETRESLMQTVFWGIEQKGWDSGFKNEKPTFPPNRTLMNFTLFADLRFFWGLWWSLRATR